MSVGSAPTERIVNPMDGRVERRRSAAPPPTRLMVLCRYALPLVVASGLLVWSALPDPLGTGLLAPWTVWLVTCWMLGAGANGSWWSGWVDAWHLGMAIQTAVLVLALAWSLIADDRLVIAFAATATIGAVLGIAALHGWQALQRSRA